MLREGGHPFDNPAIDEDLDGDDGDDDHELPPVEELAVGQVPVEGDQRDVEPIDDHPDDRPKGPEPHEGHVLPLDRDRQEEAREENEAQELGEEPVAPRGAQEVSMVPMGDANYF